jgi:precorrin-8X/cobalt-precorrin-8 methylmutase
MSDAHPIEAESYRILHERVDLSAWPLGAREVVARLIHATADPGYATSVRIGERAVDAAVGGLARGSPVVVDTTMVAAGTPRVATTCLLHEVPVAPRGSTRAAAAFALAAQRYPEGAIWVVGNAPSALFELLSQHRRGEIDPTVVIGLPVGFVGAAESKAQLWDGPLGPIAITNSGDRGGSPVAAAALNALHHLHRGDTC